MRQILQYLKRHRVTDTQTIDKLFVSTYIIVNRIRVVNNSFILEYLLPDGENSSEYLSWMLQRVRKKKIKFGLEELISLFEFVISPSDRVVTGAVYTPMQVREKIVSRCLCPC